MPTKRVEAGITRFDIDERGTHGFMVRISRQDQKFNRFFSDKEYGGKRKALLAARSHYQELKTELPPARTSKDVKSARNKTGRVGVHLAVNPSETWEDVEYSSYVASWKTEEGKRQKISFSVQKYGKKKAFELACIARSNETTDRKWVEKQQAAGKGKAAKKSPKKKVAKKLTSAPKKPAKPPKPTKKKAAAKKKVTKKAAGKKKKSSRK